MDRVQEKLGKYPCLEWAIALIPVVLEFMQQFDLCPGIFDIYDLVCYITPIVMFFKIFLYEKNKKILVLEGLLPDPQNDF